jgi:hypothetical protein
MTELQDLYKNTNNLHHAILLVGGEGVVDNLKKFLEENLGVKTQGNPDFQHLVMPTFTIEHARDLVELQSVKGYEINNKIFIIQTDFITEEAQNALLKVFEEPTEGTHFFIVSPQVAGILPTLKSRMLLDFEEGQEEAKKREKSILKMSIDNRLKLVKEITDKISDEEGTKQDAIALLNNIEEELYNASFQKNSGSLLVTQNAREYLYDRGAPVKMILEYVMLNI